MLTVEFAGEVHHVADAITFGRAGDICIDENEYMHRWVGEFLLHEGLWWLRNRGSRIPLTLIADDGKWVQLPPESTQVLSEGGGVVRFQAGHSNYELSYRGAPAPPDSGAAPLVDNATQTVQFAISLTPREVDFLACFATPSVTQASGGGLATYAQVAAVWGVSVKTIDNTLQNLRRKIKEAGLMGVDSADAVVAFARTHGLIGQADIEWAAIGELEGPRPAADGPRFTAT